MNETRFVSEIQQQPAALGTVADYYSELPGEERLGEARERMGRVAKIVFTGMGTSLYVPYLVYWKFAKVFSTVAVFDAGELLHFGLDSFDGDEVLVAVSQSGESAETRQVVEKLQGRIPVISITNNESSSMARNSELVLPIHCGEEASISTKSYTNTMAVLLLLAAAATGGDRHTERDLLRRSAQVMEASLVASREQAGRAVKWFGELSALHLIARGTDLVTARQFALIVKEGAGVFSEALSGGLYRHGPLELAGPHHRALFITSRGSEPGLTRALARETAGAGSRVVMLADEKNGLGPADELAECVISTDGFPARFFPLLAAPFIEFFVDEAARKKGKQAGIFQRAQKITAVE